MNLEWINLLIDYHIDMTGRVWNLIDKISDEQFIAEGPYSRGSIRNLMVHLASTERRWLAGLKNQPDVGHVNMEDYATPSKARKLFQDVAADLSGFVSSLNESDLEEHTDMVSEPCWQILVHLVNHGTDHRATVLQQLHELGAPTFPQDFVIWLWEKK